MPSITIITFPFLDASSKKRGRSHDSYVENEYRSDQMETKDNIVIKIPEHVSMEPLERYRISF